MNQFHQNERQLAFVDESLHSNEYAFAQRPTPKPRRKNGVADRSNTVGTPSLRLTASMPLIHRRAASLFFFGLVLRVALQVLDVGLGLFWLGAVAVRADGP